MGPLAAVRNPNSFLHVHPAADQLESCTTAALRESTLLAQPARRFNWQWRPPAHGDKAFVRHHVNRLSQGTGWLCSGRSAQAPQAGSPHGAEMDEGAPAAAGRVRNSNIEGGTIGGDRSRVPRAD